MAFTGNGQAVQQLNLTAPLSGVYTVVISASINAPASTGVYTLRATGVPPPPDEDVDLTVDSVRVAQVVFDPDINQDGAIDLVANKPAVALVKVKATGVKPGDSRTFKVRAQIVDASNQPFLEEFSLPVALTHIPAAGKDVEVYFTPTLTRQGQFEITVDAENTIAEGVHEDNNSRTSALDIKSTRDLNVTYVRFGDCKVGGCYESVGGVQMNNTVNQSDELIRATFPIGNYTSSVLPIEYRSEVSPGTIGLDALAVELLEFAYRANLSQPSVPMKVIGIAPGDYFEYHAKFDPTVQPTATGVSFPGLSAALVEEGTRAAVAHELGHMFGIAGGELSSTGEEYFPGYPGNPAAGFWVSKKARVDNAICFMGREKIELAGYDQHWIDDVHYGQLFRALRTSPLDPEVLLVSGILHRNGQVDLRPLHFLPNGFATESIAGSVAVRVLNAIGETLAEVTLPGDFVVRVEDAGLQEVNAVPFLVTIPFPQNAAKLEIVGAQGAVLVSINASTRLLIDAINAIPDFGFRELPSQRRGALLGKAAAISRAVAARDAKGAVQNLIYDFRNAVWSWLVDGYLKTELTQLQKEEVLGVIDAIAVRLSNAAK